MSTYEEPVFARSTPMQALLRWWPLAVVAALLGGAIGFYAGKVGPVTYSAEARVAVGAGDLTSGAIAGFPLAAEQLASNYARYVNDQMLAGVGDASVVATPIPDSNVIRILSTSGGSGAARTAASEAAVSLVKKVNASAAAGSDAQLKPYQQAVAAWSDAQRKRENWQTRVAQLTAQGGSAAAIKRAKANVFRLTQTVVIADSRKEALGSKYEASLTSSSASKLILVQRARVVESDRSARLQRYSLLGMVSGVVVALVAANLIERLRRPRKRLRAA